MLPQTFAALHCTRGFFAVLASKLI